MAIFLGVDTGGTYTDAVLLEDERRVLAKAKALTTRHDLSVGIGAAIDNVLSASGIAPKDIALVSLSTTLATNALVEEQGGRVMLISIGFEAADLARQGLGDALRGDPVVQLAGGHGHAGQEIAPLDLAALDRHLDDLGETVSAFAVAGQFATRNPAHEIAVRDHLIARTGKPVSCSHDLSARLNGPKRAITAVLNARLIGMIGHLISAARDLMAEKGMKAPLMVVRGDGALISASVAALKPIETILSGPAASLVGARWLTGASNALVSDIGGTTTDIAVLQDGRPKIDPLGARVGPFRTMVEAVAMRTHGLGGDSEVHVAREGLAGGVVLGPRRVMPISLLAMDAPELVHGALARQAGADRAGEYDGRFVLPLKGRDRRTDGLDGRARSVLERLGDAPAELGRIVQSRMDYAALVKLVSRGLAMFSGVTPSDAAHVLGRQTGWDRNAAEIALGLFARQRTGSGNRLAESAEDMAGIILQALCDQTVDLLLQSAFAEDDHDFAHDPKTLAAHPLTLAGLDQHRGLVALNTRLNVPVIGLGASASTHYPAVGKRLGSEMICPEHADVANALGAVVGQVSIRLTGSITVPSEGRFRVHFESGPEDFNSQDAALTALGEQLQRDALKAALDAGALEPEVHLSRDIRNSTVEGREVFIEATLEATASGRPRIATG